MKAIWRSTDVALKLLPLKTRRIAQADVVEPAVELDILDAGWDLTVDTHLNRVPKACIHEAVGEANCIWSAASMAGSAGRRRDRVGA